MPLPKINVGAQAGVCVHSHTEQQTERQRQKQRHVLFEMMLLVFHLNTDFVIVCIITVGKMKEQLLMKIAMLIKNK